ncbi:MAG: prephenate dehydrogenase [Pseudarcicella sp.]|nr:prephenate dehydrogenase [Pseudarcicella sp.]MBP6410816.1 prephenate dehydrogenase [Pseudarcicella sp.]
MKISIVGLGLIGGSIALALRKSGFATSITGVDNNQEHALKAISLRLVDQIDTLQNAILNTDIIILATPVHTLHQLLPKILDDINQNQIVIEVGSTKKNVIDSIAQHPKRNQFVASHPMAGTEFSGPEAALEDLFVNKVCVICDPEKSNTAMLETVKNMFQQYLKMRLVYMKSEDHDVHTAYISHISHICSFALASTVLAKEKDEESIFNLASTGFESTVRLAKSNPETWIPIFEQNQDNIIDVLDEYINTLLKYKGLMMAGGYDKLKEFLYQANDIKRILNK